MTKSVFYSKNIQYAYNFYGTDPYVNVCRGVFRTQSNIYGGASLQKSLESFIVNVQLGCKYASGIGFTVEKVYRMLIFIWYGQSRLQKFVIAFFFLSLIKKTCWFSSFWFALQMNELVLRHERVNEEVVNCYQVFCCCWQVKYIQKRLNKNTISQKRITVITAQKMKFSIEDFFSKCD